WTGYDVTQIIIFSYLKSLGCDSSWDQTQTPGLRTDDEQLLLHTKEESVIEWSSGEFS
ncbi:Hypothetical protein SMAX5B_008105, partial [Scophthalmus maximus]